MKPSRPILVAFLVLALVGVVAGCGGGSSSSTSSTSTSTENEAGKDPARATLIKEGDAICQATDEVTVTLQEEFKKAADPTAANYEVKLSELLTRVVVIGRTEAEELSALEPSAADSTTFKRWLAVGQEGLNEFESAALALKKEGRSPKFSRIYEEGQSKLTQANQIARKLGFDICGGQRI